MAAKTIHKTFVDDKVLNNLDKLTPQIADKLSYAVVKLDDEGNVELYNRYNYEEFADFQGRSVIGKNYFDEVAPCTNNFMFSGRFNRGVQNGEMDFMFDYCFTYKMTPTNVKVHLYRDQKTDTNWVFLKTVG